MKKNKRIVLLSVFIIIVIALMTSLFILTQNNKSNKLSLEKFTKIVTEFDYEDNVTIKKTSSNNRTPIIIKLSKLKKSISNDLSDDTKTIYFEEKNDSFYKYYYEDNKWKRKEEKESSSLAFNNFNLRKYINIYNSFKVSKDSYLYTLDKYIDNDEYSNIELIIKDNKIKKYAYEISDIKYEYEFSYYDNTIIDLPQEYSDVYDKLSYDMLNTLLNNTTKVANFMAVSLYKDTINGVEYDTKATIYKTDSSKQYIEIIDSSASYQYLYQISGLVEKQYEYINYEWILKKEEPSLVSQYDQYSLLPVNLIIKNYEKISYNEFGSSYTILDITIDDLEYSELYFIVDNERITYISMKYNYTLDNVNHEVSYIIEFSDFNNITFDDIN